MNDQLWRGASGCHERRFDTEWERDESFDVAGRVIDDDGAGKTGKDIANGFLEIVDLSLARDQRTKDDAPHFFEFSRMFELRQHPVDCIGLLVDVFEEEDRIPRFEFIIGFDTRCDEGETSPHQRPCSFSGFEDGGAFARKYSERIGRDEGMLQVFSCEGRVRAAELRYDGPIEGGDMTFLAQPHEQGRDIRNTDDGFAMSFDGFGVEQGNDTLRAVSATSEKDRLDLRFFKEFHEFLCAAVVIASEISVFGKDILAVIHLKTELMKDFNPFKEEVFVKGTCRCCNTDGVARSEWEAG